jgi:acyl-CoA thioester hydrolase
VVELVVPFHDLDPMQIVWHGNYLKYFDVARHALFEEAGIDLQAYGEQEGYVFPVVKTSSKHIHPLRHRDRISCAAEVVEVRRKIVIDFEIHDMRSGRLCARCRSEQVAVRTADFGMEILIPEEIQQALSA